jgi:hypothetical protein
MASIYTESVATGSAGKLALVAGSAGGIVGNLIGFFHC